MSKPVRVETREQTFKFTAANKVGAESAVVDINKGEWAESLRENAKSARPFVSNPLRSARELLGGIPEINFTLNYTYDPRHNRLTDTTRGLRLSDPDEQLAKDYLAWCKHGRKQPGDCLSLLEDRPILSADGRFAIALAFALGAPVLDGMEDELRNLTNANAITTTIISTVTMLLIVLSLPEPVTKGIAAIMAAVTICYLGYDVFYRLIDGWIDMTQAAGSATTFAELRQSGEAYGRRLGEKAAMFFVILAMAAMGNSASQLAGKVPKLPGFNQATAAGNNASGINLATAIDKIQTVAVSSGGVIITVAPIAVAMNMDEGSRARPAGLNQQTESRPNSTEMKPSREEARQPPAPRPEKGYLENKKHGLDWTEGAATARSLRKPQGQWGSIADLEFAGQKAAILEPGKGAFFDLPKGHNSFVWRVDGTRVPANRIWVRNNGTGTFHGYPLE